MNACCVYDFTDNNYNDVALVLKWCKQYCKMYCFVGEEVSRKHWQGRISLKIKKRLKEIPNPLGFHFSITSNENKKNNFYIEKGETAITEIYKDTDEEIYIPRQIREVEERGLYAWQQTIVDSVGIWDTRSINIVIDTQGCIGKSSLIGYLRAHKLARCLPPVNDYKDCLRMVCDLPTARCYCIDMPRCLKKDKLYGFFSAIETIKDGYAYDDRYNFKEKVFDCPNIWVFTNREPDMNMLSLDRWKLWCVRDKELRDY